VRCLHAERFAPRPPTSYGEIQSRVPDDDYARAGIGEYWIVDPFKRAVEVYRLDDSGEDSRRPGRKTIDRSLRSRLSKTRLN